MPLWHYMTIPPESEENSVPRNGDMNYSDDH